MPREVTTSCHNGHEFTAPVIEGAPLQTPHVVCPVCGRERVVPGLVRVPGGVVQGDGATHYAGARLPISRSLPRRDTAKGTPANQHGHQILEYPDGARTNLMGQPIIDGHNAADRESKRTGFTRDDAPPPPD
jgi:hypothetical protein